MRYQDLIMQFIHQAMPSVPVSPTVRFEALAATVFGTKQRRFGPMPPPETQVAVRDVLRECGPIQFFLPWGASKQTAGAKLDLLEFMAVKQLRCLADDLRRHEREVEFSFRVEDLTDRFLFDGKRPGQIAEYVETFSKLVKLMLPGSRPVLESQLVTWEVFRDAADRFAPVFYSYLRSDTAVERLYEIGWKGTIPQEQRDYYAKAYVSYYPGEDPTWHMAKYFAATLARVTLKATAAPHEPHLLIAFTHPVPGNPIDKPRLYYRTIPEKYTNHHVSPWIGKGYFQIGETNECCPRVVRKEESVELIDNTLSWGGINIDAPYALT